MKEKLARICIDPSLLKNIFPKLTLIDNQISDIARDLHPETFKHLKELAQTKVITVDFLRNLYLLKTVLTNIANNTKTMTNFIDDIVNDENLFGILKNSQYYSEKDAQKRGISDNGEGIFDVQTEEIS